MRNKKLIVPIVASIATVLLLTGISYAYFSAKIKETNKTETVIKSNELGLIFTGETEINEDSLIPGDSFTKTFKVENTSNRAVTYNIYMQNITNEFNEDLVYTLTDETGEVVAETKAPDTNTEKTYILSNIEIGATSTKTYTLKVEFKYLATPQNDNQGSSFKATLGIDANKVESSNTPAVTPVSFADDSWDTIGAAVKTGNISAYNVGDTKTIDLGDLGTHTVRLANTSACTNGETSETACGFVVEFADIITRQAMNSSSTNVGGWPVSELRTYVNETIYNALPTDLQSVIVYTTVVSSHGSTEGEENFTSTDKLYLLSTKEVWGKDGTSNTISRDTAEAETRQLDYYKNLGVTTSNFSEVKKQYNSSDFDWWLRSAGSKATFDFFFASATGDWSSASSTNTNGVSPAFRIA